MRQNKKQTFGSIGRRLSQDKKSKGLFLLDIAIAVMSVVTVLCLIAMVLFFLEEKDYSYENYSFQSAVMRQDYGSVMEMAGTNRCGDIHVGDAEYEEYYAVGDYFEAALYEKIYTQQGEQELAAEWAKKKESAASRLYVMSPEKEKIDSILEK